MKVKWTEPYRPTDFDLDWISDQDFSEWDQNHEGQVIGVTTGPFGINTYLIVACFDGKIRKVNKNRCTAVFSFPPNKK